MSDEATKRIRSKTLTKIQKKVDGSALGLGADAEVWVDLPTEGELTTTAKAVSLLRKVKKVAGDEFRVVGVKKIFKAATKEVVDVMEEVKAKTE